MNKQDFLVEIEVSLPHDLEPARRADLLAAELARGHELVGEGTIARIWRVPGRLANVGIWTTMSASQLHEKISSLPLFPWMQVAVRPLAVHPLEEKR